MSINVEREKKREGWSRVLNRIGFSHGVGKRFTRENCGSEELAETFDENLWRRTETVLFEGRHARYKGFSCFALPRA